MVATPVFLGAFGVSLPTTLIFQQSFDVLRANAAPIGGTALAFALIPELISGFSDWTNVSAQALILSGLMTLLGAIFITQMALNYTAGRPVWDADTQASFQDSYFKAVALSLVFSIGVLIGFILFIAPGVWLYALWFVALPVLINEGAGITQALQRSKELATGRMRPILAMVVVMLLSYLLLVVVLSLILPTGAGGEIATLSAANLLLAGLMGLIGAYFIIVPVVTYRHLLGDAPRER
jgi:hypothetical protein